MDEEDKYIGWISVHRKILKHWIIGDPYYFSAWIVMLLEVNHDHRVKKKIIKKQVVECGRGQSIKSIDTWATVFGSKYWTRQKVRTFFQLLEKDGMINQQNLSVTTRLTICNFDTYQKKQPSDNQQSNHHVTIRQPSDNHQITTNNNDNNGDNGNNEENTPPNPLEGGTGCDETKDESFHLDAQPQPKAKRERKPAQRNPIMDALATHAEGVTDLSQVTPSAWKQIAKAASDIKAVCPDVTPDEIRRRVIAYFTAMPNATCTSTAIAKHWARCDGRKPGAKPEETERERLERLARQHAEDICNLNFDVNS